MGGWPCCPFPGTRDTSIGVSDAVIRRTVEYNRLPSLHERADTSVRPYRAHPQEYLDTLLLMAQGHDGVHAHGAPGRQVAGQQSHQGQQQGNPGKRGRIARADAEQEPPQDS